MMDLKNHTERLYSSLKDGQTKNIYKHLPLFTSLSGCSLCNPSKKIN